ncbi:MAG: Txe/YoeB family addiction module toxin [Treponema sp.]|nr:Txe/YoeB family addiction module toxin [Treponema sp.]
MYLIKYDKQAQKDAKNLKAAKLDTKAKEIIETLKENPLKNPPPYEELVGNLAGLYSRRINLKHRIVYEIIEKTITEKDIEYEGIVKVIRMWTHYDKVK